MRAFPWLVSIDSGTNKLHRVENRWNYTKKTFRVTLTQAKIQLPGAQTPFARRTINHMQIPNVYIIIEIWYANVWQQRDYISNEVRECVSF